MKHPACFDPPDDTILQRAAGIRLLGLDVDGVLTDGTVWYGPGGESLKPFNILDGLGIRMLLDAGLAVAIITARRSIPLAHRARDLGIPHLYMGVTDKLAAWNGLLQKLALHGEQAAYMGDDLIDLKVLRRAGLSLTVPNGHPLLARHSHWCSRRAGGSGAVREACELILHAQGLLDPLLERYLND
ncbi:MAG: HAD hydrolase family protein [Ectothiorhodospiraceae bacterium]|nr:HAD hydrolase family protein [Ectothiorhodospiraceae bacterium]